MIGYFYPTEIGTFCPTQNGRFCPTLTLLYYVGTVVLNMNEEVFWRSTLRKLHAVFRCHCEHMPKAGLRK